MFIPRDYSVGCGVQFQTKLPPELEGKIDRDKFEFTVTSLNNLYTEAESANCSTYTEGGQQGRLKVHIWDLKSFFFRMHGVPDCLCHIFLL